MFNSSYSAQQTWNLFRKFRNNYTKGDQHNPTPSPKKQIKKPDSTENMVNYYGNILLVVSGHLTSKIVEKAQSQ